MAVIKYTAKRSLISGHSVDVLYSMEVKLTELAPSSAIDKSQPNSISGNVRTIFRSRKKFWNVTMGSFARLGGEGSMEQMEEFLDSIDAGEVFTFDAHGTLALPDNEQNCIFSGNGYRPARMGTLERFYVSYQIRVL